MMGLGNVGGLGRLGYAAANSVGWWLSGAQLDLDFANDRSFNRKTGYQASPNGLLTYTSPSPKMVYGTDGVLRYARHNLLPYSEQFDNAAWTPYASSVSSNATIAPNGTTTADKLVEDVSLAYHFVYAAAATVATHSTVSVYLKAGERTWGWLYISSAAEAVAYFNLSAGTIGTVSGTLSPSATITNVGGGWYRCSITARISSSVSCGVGVATSNGGISYTGNGSSGIYVWGAQRNLGSVVLDYLATTSAAKYDLPIDYHPTTHAALGVLIEEQRTNLLTYSQEFDNAVWSKSSATIAANDAVAPDGTTTADKLKPDAAATNGRVIQTFTGAIGTTYTLSIYAAADEFSNLRLYFDDGATNTASVSYNLTTGAITTALAITGGNWTSAATTYTDVGDGWRRVTLTFTATAVAPTRMAYWCRDTGDGASGIHVWGAQLEAGAFATSYIQTGSAQVTRAVDQVSLATSAFNFVDATGTCVVELDTNFDGAAYARDIVRFTDGSNDYVRPYAYPSRAGLSIVDSSVAQCDISVGSGRATGVPFSLACAWADNDMAAVVNGGTVGVDTSGTMPTGMTTVRIGFSAANTNVLSGHIKRFTYWNTRKSNAELQVLSA